MFIKSLRLNIFYTRLFSNRYRSTLQDPWHRITGTFANRSRCFRIFFTVISWFVTGLWMLMRSDRTTPRGVCCFGQWVDALAGSQQIINRQNAANPEAEALRHHEQSAYKSSLPCWWSAFLLPLWAFWLNYWMETVVVFPFIFDKKHYFCRV